MTQPDTREKREDAQRTKWVNNSKRGIAGGLVTTDTAMCSRVEFFVVSCFSNLLASGKSHQRSPTEEEKEKTVVEKSTACEDSNMVFEAIHRK